MKTTLVLLCMVSVLTFSCIGEEQDVSQRMDTMSNLISDDFVKITSLEDDATLKNLIQDSFEAVNGRTELGTLDYSRAELGYHKDGESFSSVIPYSRGNTSLVVVGNRSGVVYDARGVQIDVEGARSRVNYYTPGGAPTLSYTLERGQVYNMTQHRSMGANSWESCVLCAVDSCTKDAECLVLCALSGPWCIAAIAIACTQTPELDC